MEQTTQPIAELGRLAHMHRLEILGVAPARVGDPLPAEARSVVLLGPSRNGFWAHVRGQPEFADGAADPLDRWSRRVIGAIAEAVRGRAVLPFGGPPHAPFADWARRSGRVWASPVGLLIHERAGLWLSFRGAVALSGPALPSRGGTSPCLSCPGQPCLSACPAGALIAGGYDLAACHEYLDTAAGAHCMQTGCAVRRACPVSRGHGQDAEQSAHHMRAFHP